MLSDLLRNPELAAGLIGPQIDVVREPHRILAATAASGMRYDGTDTSEWQDPDPDFGAIGGDMFVCRLCDGRTFDSTFVRNWQRAQSLPCRWKGWYALPDPRLGWQAQHDLIVEFYGRAGVAWGAPGHFFSIDDEPTTYHDQFVGSEMISLRQSLLDTFVRLQELHYVGLYNGNLGFCTNQGWPCWAPWPTGNGAMPSWTPPLVSWQWGVAGPGEVPGYARASVDVDMTMDAAALDAIAGIGTEVADMTPDESAQLAQLSAENHFLFSVFHDDGGRWGQLWTAALQIARVLQLGERLNANHFIGPEDVDLPLPNLLRDTHAAPRLAADREAAAVAARSAIAGDVAKIAAAGPGGPADYAALAKALVDELARRGRATTAVTATSTPVDTGTPAAPPAADGDDPVSRAKAAYDAAHA